MTRHTPTDEPTPADIRAAAEALIRFRELTARPVQLADFDDHQEQPAATVRRPAPQLELADPF